MTEPFFAARLGLAAFLILAAVAPPASAQFDEDAADRRALQLYEEGEVAYTEGRYEAAVRAFTAAHRLSPRPLLLYNLANAYERLGRYAEAVEALDEYLPDAPIDERAVLQTRLRNLRLRVAGDAPQPTAEPAPIEPEEEGASLLVPGIVIAAGGVALVGAGIVFGGLALDARSVLEAPDGCTATDEGRTLCLAGTEGTFADAQLSALLADIGLIGGGAIAAAGLLLVIIGALDDAETEPSQATWAPDLQVGPAGVSLGARGRF